MGAGPPNNHVALLQCDFYLCDPSRVELWGFPILTTLGIDARRIADLLRNAVRRHRNRWRRFLRRNHYTYRRRWLDGD